MEVAGYPIWRIDFSTAILGHEIAIGIKDSNLTRQCFKFQIWGCKNLSMEVLSTRSCQNSTGEIQVVLIIFQIVISVVE